MNPAPATTADTTSPGPWSCQYDGAVVDNDGTPIAHVATDDLSELEVAANAHLMAASWGLREVLRVAVEYEEQMYRRRLAAASANNNSDGVGQRFGYESAAPLPAWVALAKIALAQAEKGPPPNGWRNPGPRMARIERRDDLPASKRWTAALSNVVGGVIGDCRPSRTLAEEYLRLTDLRLVLEHGVPPAVIGAEEPRRYV